MAKSAMLSIYGLYLADNTIFDNLVLPEAEIIGDVQCEAVDRETLIFQILSDFAELEILYPDPDFMKEAIGFWSRSRLAEWRKLNMTLYLTWNPLHNYDRQEETTVTEKGTNIGVTNGKSTGTAKTKVAAYNSGDLIENQNEESEANSNGTNTLDIDTTKTHNSRISGNIGVTTSDQMVAQFRETVKYNIYDTICEEFKNRFCVMVY